MLKLQLMITLEAGAKMLKLEANFSCILASYIFFYYFDSFLYFFSSLLAGPFGTAQFEKKSKNQK